MHYVGLHDTGEHTDYFSAPYMTIFLTDEARRAKYIFEDFKTSRTFLFLHSTFLMRTSNVAKT